jgi:hypothetical protein
MSHSITFCLIFLENGFLLRAVSIKSAFITRLPGLLPRQLAKLPVKLCQMSRDRRQEFDLALALWLSDRDPSVPRPFFLP